MNKSDIDMSDFANVRAELAVRNVIALYGMAADCGDIDTALSCHCDDAEYIVSNPAAGRGADAPDLILRGHSAIADMLGSQMHQSLLPNCAHTVGPLAVKVYSDAAIALGYSRVYHQSGSAPQLMRLAFNKWDLRLQDKAWRIARRESRVMGEAAAQSLLRKTLKSWGKT